MVCASCHRAADAGKDPRANGGAHTQSSQLDRPEHALELMLGFRAITHQLLEGFSPEEFRQNHEALRRVGVVKASIAQSRFDLKTSRKNKIGKMVN